MKEIEIKKTKLSVKQLKGAYQLDSSEPKVDYCGIIEVALDFPPQGGFTPHDIKQRNRIQVSIDETKGGILKLEDADYESLLVIINNSKWGTRDKELAEFLNIFKE